MLNLPLPLILASSSPRRQELLNQAGFEHRIKVSNVDENLDESLSPGMLVRSLAEQKARSVAESLNESEAALVIGADTIVVLDNTILGKPKDEEDARRMIALLQGNTHQVFTGICVINSQSGKCISHAEKTDVSFSEMSDEEIFSYVEKGESLDKAGAYGIQGSCALYISKINGCYFNVMGLPLNALYKVLKEF